MSVKKQSIDVDFMGKRLSPLAITTFCIPFYKFTKINLKTPQGLFPYFPGLYSPQKLFGSKIF